MQAAEIKLLSFSSADKVHRISTVQIIGKMRLF